jgi:pyrroline-5-carboxylate reductase
MKAMVFLGGGRITGALVAGLRLAKCEPPIIVYDRNLHKLQALRRESRIEIARSLKSALARAEIVIVAVRPGSMTELLHEVAACGARPRLCVSLAAGIPLKRLREQLGPPTCWVRAMPSPVSRIAKGLTGLCFDRNISRADRARIRELFGMVGAVLEIPEPQFDVFTATYSSSHGYHALATMAQAAQGIGLDRRAALTAAAHALSDAISYWRESKLDLRDLLHEAATPGGVAAATIEAMQKSGYSRALTRGLRAGIKRAQQNAKLGSRGQSLRPCR